MRTVRILLVGDDRVGKSSLVTALISDCFVPMVQHVVPEIAIPPEWTRENVSTCIVDSSPREENKEQLEAEIRRADVICVVYAVDNIDSFDRISTHWLPYIRRLGRNVPVVLVGNKIDVRGENMNNDLLDEQVMPIMNEFKEVETCVECSCKAALNVSEVFYFALKAVLHPTAPLYDSREHTLKPLCIDALRRIFKLCDIDKNGILDDDEINEFQMSCFGAPLQKHELENVKQAVQNGNNEHVKDDGLTELGFLYLHTLFIQRGRLETTWAVLRTFGYGDDLTLREDFLHPKIDIPVDCSVELSSDGYQFFIELFQAFDKDKDGALNEAELKELFGTSPGNPWTKQSFPQAIILNDFNGITLQGFLALWSMTTLLDYRTTLAYLAYLGYPGDTLRGIKISRPRKQDLKKKKLQRDVLLCYVFGAPGSGKTSILKGLINKSTSELEKKPTQKPVTVVNSLEISGSEKYLVMQEFGAPYETEVLQNKKKMDACDIVCFVYDSSDPNSFAYVANLKTQYRIEGRPCLFIATKSDLDLVPQRFKVQPDDFCRKLDLPVPISLSMKDNFRSDIYNVLVSIAAEPFLAMPGQQFSYNQKLKWTIAVTSVSVALLGAFIIYRASSR